jgi:hypothetical protein
VSLTVTATRSGAGVSGGMALAVKAVTGAAAAQTGSVAASETVTVPQLAITPAGNGSWVYGAVLNGAVNTAYTANGATVFGQNVADAVSDATYGAFRSTGTTTAGTPVTLGGSAPSESSGFLYIALAEILSAGTLAEDSSSPAALSSSTASSLATASFSPPAGALLVAMTSSDWSGSGSVTFAVSGGGYTWAQLSGTGTVGLASVWVAQVPSVPPPANVPVSPSPFSPLNWRRQARPARGPLLVTQADTGSGADTATAGNLVTTADTGSGADTGGPGFTAADTGAAADAGAVTATVHGADTGSGADSGTSTVPVAGADTGAGTEGSAVTVRTVLTVRWSAADKLNRSGGVMGS